MEIPSSYNSCEHAKANFTLYPLLDAALLWCGTPPSQLNSHREKVTEVISGVFSLSYMTCLEPRCRLINDAIDRGVLPVCREKGNPVNDHVAPNRRHLRGKDLREWIAKEHPNEKPAFLFDEIERSVRTDINKEAYTALKADKDAAVLSLREITTERDNLSMETAALKACIDKMTPVIKEPLTETERGKLLKQIGVMALVLAEKSNKYKRGAAPNALQIANEAQEILDAGAFSDIKGTGSTELRHSISEGLKLLQPED
ncbi:MAG: hypothetical protein ACNA7G_10815 [Methylobacter sp.]